MQSACLLAVSPDGAWLAASGATAGVLVYSVRQLKVSVGLGHSKQGEVRPALTRLREDGEHLQSYWPFCLFVCFKQKIFPVFLV